MDSIDQKHSAAIDPICGMRVDPQQVAASVIPVQRDRDPPGGHHRKGPWTPRPGGALGFRHRPDH